MAATTHLPVLVPSEPLDRTPDPAAVAEWESHVHSFAPPSFDEAYREHFPFVWRSAKRLGVHPAALDDVVQEIFVVVHRNLPRFEGRSSLRTWLFGITLRVVRDHRRSRAVRAGALEPLEPDALQAPGPGPRDALEQAEAVRLLHALLDELDDDRREIFVMAELEQMTMPEIASTLGLNVNTAYGRLRAARHAFEAALARHRAREARR